MNIEAKQCVCAVWLGVLTVMTLSPSLAAENTTVRVYECQQGGTPSFSDEPCEGAGAATDRSIEVDYTQPDAAQSRAAAESLAVQEEQADKVADLDLLNADILSQQQRIKNLEMERDARIAALRRQLAEGTERLDKNVWESQIYQQIDTIQANYNDTIIGEQQHLAELNARRASMDGQGRQALPAP